MSRFDLLLIFGLAVNFSGDNFNHETGSPTFGIIWLIVGLWAVWKYWRRVRDAKR